MNRKKLIERITIDPRVCGGKPCIRDTRIYIAVILDGLAEGMTAEQIQDHYPQITIEDIHAALAYAAEGANREAGETSANLCE